MSGKKNRITISLIIIHIITIPTGGELPIRIGGRGLIGAPILIGGSAGQEVKE